MTKLVRTTKHSLKNSNVLKREKVNSFIAEYRKVSKLYLEYLWNNKVTYEIKDKTFSFDIQNNELSDIPTMLSNVDIEKHIDTGDILSGRAKKCSLSQILGCIKSEVKKQSNRLFILHKKLNAYENPSKALIKKCLVNKPSYPDLSKLNPELNSICIDWKAAEGEFNGFLKLKSLGKSFGTINLPIKFHRNNKKYKNWKLLNSFLINEDFVDFRWQSEIEDKKTGKIVGADQGFKTIISFSDEQVTPKTNSHNKSLESILREMSVKKKGSKAFLKSQEERKNFVNWSINQLNLSDVKEIRLEKVYNVNYKSRTSRLMSHWNNPEIRDKIKSIAELSGVQVKEQSCTYRSQRCSNCGNVRKANRKKKDYVCKSCGFTIDADINAAKNHEQNLPDVPFTFRGSKMNLGDGFRWLESGFFSMTGEELTVPLSKNIITS